MRWSPIVTFRQVMADMAGNVTIGSVRNSPR
jgi:uncharacterized membrane protein